MSKVYLDYLMPRESFRFLEERKSEDEYETTDNRGDIRLRDIAEDWFKRLRKPDFQRETNAWTPETCVALLESLVRRDVIPGIIVWKSESSPMIYVIDGAHRLSVIRAWMLNDWGDKQIEYYNEGQREEIVSGADEVRALVQERLGSYAEFIEANRVFFKVSADGRAPKSEMPDQQFKKALFYSRVKENVPIVIQWATGSYEKAEMSFLQINRNGERLSTFEQMLIEYRNGPYARVVSSIVSAGKTGYFWPEKHLDAKSAAIVKEFPRLASAIHNTLFRPPHNGEVRDLNQPLVISKPGDRFEDCLDLVALVADNVLLIDDNAKKDILAKNAQSDAREIILIGEKIFKVVLDRLSQLLGENVNSKSLGIVPLLYTYSHQGSYSKNLLYGLLYWLFSGPDDEVQTKKIALSANRGRFEAILFRCKADITAIARKGGGFKTTKEIAGTIASIVNSLLRTGEKSESEAIDIVMNNLDFKQVSPSITVGRSATLGKEAR